MHRNCRSAAWWNLRELLDPSRDSDLALPADDMLLGDLTAPKWKVLSGGKIQVESKDDIRKRLGRSTDDGDAAVQAYWEEGHGAGAWLDWARRRAAANGSADTPDDAPATEAAEPPDDDPVAARQRARNAAFAAMRR